MNSYPRLAALLGTSFVLVFQALGQAPAAAQPPAPGQGRGPAGTETGFRTFQTKCMNCHGNPEVERAPSPAVIRQMSPERIYAALTTGPMAGQGQSLSDTEKKMLALFMSGRPLGSEEQGDAKNMPNQ